MNVATPFIIVALYFVLFTVIVMLPVAVSLTLTIIVALVAALTLTISSIESTGIAFITLNVLFVLFALYLSFPL